MTPRSTHRRKTFWLGLLILIFLTWAWHHSYWYGSGIGWGNQKKYLGASSILGVAEFRYVEALPGTSSPARLSSKGFTSFHQDSSWWHPRQPSQLPVHYQGETASGDPHVVPPLPPWFAHEVTIAWWFITLLHLIAWLATLTWLHRRQHRLLEKHASR
ncbi:MAG: hypothetical protein EOP83_28605 [Verrucomicrobiaceae bacterium]|nr:MAG: hypothetical protein EOP83_28605 [Verrucomicrobiaceae bacterium]